MPEGSGGRGHTAGPWRGPKWRLFLVWVMRWQSTDKEHGRGCRGSWVLFGGAEWEGPAGHPAEAPWAGSWGAEGRCLCPLSLRRGGERRGPKSEPPGAQTQRAGKEQKSPEKGEPRGTSGDSQ